MTLSSTIEKKAVTPKQLCQDIVNGKWNGAIVTTSLREAAKESLGKKT